MAISLAELKQRVRERTDKTDSEFIEEDELRYYINASIASLHDILVQSYGEDYYVKDVSWTTTAGQERYNIADIAPDGDFYKLLGLDAKLNGSEFFTLQQFNFNERNRFQNAGVWDYLGITNVRYRIVGSQLILSPQPDNNTEMRLWYIPKAQELSLDTDEFDDINQYTDYVIVDAAIRVMDKEESDVTVLAAQRQALEQRITEAARNRNASDPESVSDIYIQNDDYWYGRTKSN